jgi:acyl carrier protein
MNLPELTNEKFIPDPFADTEGERLYSTGDLVRYEDDGCLHFLGRMDNQVKIRGHRIEPAEIEKQIQRYPGVDQAAVVDREFESDDRHLMACIIMAEGKEATSTQLREHLSGLLPEYMIPNEFLFLDRFPLTPNKKLDRKALAALRPKPSAQKTKGEPFQEGLELKIAEIWMQVLGIEDLGRDDNFFDVGGDSFRAMKLHFKLQKELVTMFALTDIFSFPTVRALADHLGRRDSSDGFLKEAIRRGEKRREHFGGRK